MVILEKIKDDKPISYMQKLQRANLLPKYSKNLLLSPNIFFQIHPKIILCTFMFYNDNKKKTLVVDCIYGNIYSHMVNFM